MNINDKLSSNRVGTSYIHYRVTQYLCQFGYQFARLNDEWLMINDEFNDKEESFFVKMLMIKKKHVCLSSIIFKTLTMITRTFDLLDQYRTQYRIDDALACKVSGKWIKYSSDEYIQYANDISCGLLSLGYKQGDRIAMISNNRPEWNFFEMGMSKLA